MERCAMLEEGDIETELKYCNKTNYNLYIITIVGRMLQKKKRKITQYNGIEKGKMKVLSLKNKSKIFMNYNLGFYSV
jgi:hypothetical protein